MHVFQRRDEVVTEGQHRRHVDGRRDHIIAGLTHVDMVVGVHRGLAAHPTAQQLDGAAVPHHVTAPHTLLAVHERYSRVVGSITDIGQEAVVFGQGRRSQVLQVAIGGRTHAVTTGTQDAVGVGFGLGPLHRIYQSLTFGIGADRLEPGLDS
jgi:hypothetical protein